MKQRINYLDAAKGLCMLIIMCCHMGVNTHVPMAHTVQTTAFFMISGFFFSVKTNVKSFLLKSCKTILLPFAIFYVLSYILFYAGSYLVPGFSEMTTATSLLDCFTQRQYFNGPLWFLLCLFWVRLIVWCVISFIPKEWLQVIVAFILGWGGHLLGSQEVFLPLCFDIAMSSVPVFYVGYLIKKRAWLEKFGVIESGLLATVFYISCLALPIVIENSLNYSSGNYTKTLYVSLCISIALIFFSKFSLSNSKVIAYIGRNTMWLMCTHHLLYRPVKMAIGHFVTNDVALSWMVFSITLIICCATAPLVDKYIPIIVGKTKKQ